MPYDKPVTFTTTNHYGCTDDDDVYTIAEFLENVESGGFIDYDGHGHPVKDKMANSSIIIKPSKCPQCIPDDATHIVWYNK